MDEEMVWIPREAIGWHRMWSEIAKRYGDTACRCPETGEAWEYMGTTLRDGAPVQHCFRHRSLNGQPCSVGVDAMPDDLLPAAPTGDAAAPLTPARLDDLDEMARAAQERAEMLTPVAGGHVFRGTWEALAEFDTATCEACGEHIKQDGEPVDVVEHDGAGVGHRIMCDGWPASAAPGVLLLLARGMVREREAPDDVGDLLPARPSHEARAELYSANWDASQPHADVKPPLFRIGKAFDALSAALSDEEHALRMALEHDERSHDEVPALASALHAATAEIRRLWAETARRDARAADVAPVRAALLREAKAFSAMSGADDSAEREAGYLRRAAEVVETDREARLVLAVLGFDTGSAERVLSGSTPASSDPLDPATPMHVIDEHLRAAGLDPEEVAQSGVAFVRSLKALGVGSAPAADLATIEAAAREDKAVASRATARPWKWWTANSMRELRSEAGRRCETVAYGQQHPHDRVIDIAIQEPDMALIERAVNGLVDRADALLWLVKEVRRLRGHEAEHKSEIAALAEVFALASELTGEPKPDMLDWPADAARWAIEALRRRHAAWQAATGCTIPDEAGLKLWRLSRKEQP